MSYEWLFTKSVLFFCALVFFFRSLERLKGHQDLFCLYRDRIVDHMHSVFSFRRDDDFYCFFHTHSFERK